MSRMKPLSIPSQTKLNKAQSHNLNYFRTIFLVIPIVFMIYEKVGIHSSQESFAIYNHQDPVSLTITRSRPASSLG